MTDLLSAIGLVLAIEGAFYAASPSAAKAMMRQGLEAPERVLRMIGLGALGFGVLIVWFVRG